MPIPFPGFESRTIARPRTCPVGKSKINSMLDPALGARAAGRKTPPSPITSAREVVCCADDFQATHSPFGARMRGYFLNFAVSVGTISPRRLPCHNFIPRNEGRWLFQRSSASISYAKEYRRASTGLADRAEQVRPALVQSGVECGTRLWQAGLAPAFAPGRSALHRVAHICVGQVKGCRPEGRRYKCKCTRQRQSGRFARVCVEAAFRRASFL